MLGVCELVGTGHPDKLADQISDALVDFFIQKDPRSKCAFEVVVSKLVVSVVGEYHSRYTVNQMEMTSIVRKVLAPHIKGYEAQRMMIYFGVKPQSLEIANKCHKNELLIADQGIVYGYAERGNRLYLKPAHYIAYLFQWEFELNFKLGDYLKKDYKILVKTEGDKLKHLTVSIHKVSGVYIMG